MKRKKTTTANQRLFEVDRMPQPSFSSEVWGLSPGEEALILPPPLRGLGLDRPGERGQRVAGSLAEDCLEIDTGEARLAPYILNEERHLRPMLTHSRELAVHRVRDIDDLVDRRGRGRVEVLLHDEVGLEPGVEVLRVHQGKRGETNRVGGSQSHRPVIRV